MSTTASVLAPSSEAAHGLVDAERLRIARELHDVMSFGIATISVQAGAAAHVVDQRPDQAREALPAIKAISRETSRELRGILGLLRAAGHGELARRGLAGLDALAATATGAGLPTRVVVASGGERLSAAVDTAAYRIVQEALTNALRYAGPATATIFVTRERDRLVIEVADDGCGLSAGGERTSAGGYGIAGMRERAHALGGTLLAGPRPGGGFRVRASLPIGADS